MKIFIFNKPKKTILNLLFFLSILSIFITLVAFTAVFVWKYHPSLIEKLDKRIPNIYANEVMSLYKKAMKSKNNDIKYKYYLQLYDKLKDITFMEKFFDYKQSTNIFLIDYYLSHNNIEDAYEISEYWQKENPYNYNAKFYHIKVLDLYDKDLAVQYFNTLYKQHFDIKVVTEKYIEFSMNHFGMNSILNVDKLFSVNNNFNFRFFYTDNGNKEYENVIPKYIKNHKNNKDYYKITLEREFLNLKQLRFDIDGNTMNKNIYDLNISIRKNNITYTELNITTLHSLQKTSKSSYIITGPDPYATIVLPNGVQDSSGAYQITISFNTPNKIDIFKNLLAQSDNWKIYFDIGQGYSTTNSKQIKMNYLNETIFTTIENINLSTQALKLALPSIRDLNIKHIEIKINNDFVFTEQNISEMYGIEKNLYKLEVTKNKPYISLHFKNKIIIHTLDIKITLDEKKEKI